MPTAALADLHGNVHALDAVLAGTFPDLEAATAAVLASVSRARRTSPRR